MRHRIGFFLASSLLTLVNMPSQAMDLIQVHNLASEQDAQLMIARSNLQSTRFLLPQAESANKPQVNLAANATYQDKGNSLTSDDKQSSAGLTLSLQQNLYNAEILA
ncbi:MAG: TolC family protein, partial [Gammaproteobacteria bacterium]|nr:TolC family protein [Gammaproteobacteria bacterium]MBT7207660.1 TolC family protein [Gammaproteobacteria bacterium]